MNKRQRAECIQSLKILAISDAAPSRNGAGAYYQDLVELLSVYVEHIELYSPIIDTMGKWHAGFLLPLPGDKTQKLCLPNIFGLNRLFEEIKPDVVLIATPGVYGLCGAFLARRKQIPFLLGMHTSFEQLTSLYWPDSIRGKIVGKIFNLSNSYLFKGAESVLVNAEPVLQEALKIGAPDVKLDVKLIRTPIASKFIREEPAPYRGELQKILFAGRLAKEKNIEALLEVARLMPELEFNIAGDGPLRELVQAAVENLPNLNYLGWLSRSALQQTIDDNDALVLPSHFETFGTVALEAMARGRLVVVSPGCGISLWPSLRQGLKVIDESEGLQGAFTELLLESPQCRIGMAKQARDAAMQLNYSVVENWTQILLETLERQRHELAKVL